MEESKQRIILEKFLGDHNVEMLPTARLSHYGRRFDRFFPEIAKAVNPENQAWRKANIKLLAEYVGTLSGHIVKKNDNAPDFKRSKKFKNTNKTKAFLTSWDWRKLRYEVLKERGFQCECCGATAKNNERSGMPVRIEVDHIKPISKFWQLRLEKSNLQVLCRDCNKGKGNRYVHDHR